MPGSGPPSGSSREATRRVSMRVPRNLVVSLVCHEGGSGTTPEATRTRRGNQDPPSMRGRAARKLLCWGGWHGRPAKEGGGGFQKWIPPPGPAGRAAPAQTPLPARRPRRGRGGLGKWASVPPPPAKQFSSRLACDQEPSMEVAWHKDPTHTHTHPPPPTTHFLSVYFFSMLFMHGRLGDLPLAN